MADLQPGMVERALEEERTLLALYNPRTATCVIPAADAAAFGAALLPPEEDELGELLAGALPADGSIAAGEALALAGAAIAAALDGRVLARDELHAELRDRLPAGLLPWCRVCESHHARRSLLAAAALRGELCLAGRLGRQAAFARPDQWLGAPLPAHDADTARAGLVRRYLRRYAPSTPPQLAAWAGVPRAHAERCWALVADELAPADGGWALAEDAAAPAPAPADGVRLLPPGDPFLLARDRDRLLPDAAARRRVWRPAGAPGVVLAGGRLAGVWRGRKRGRAWSVTVEPFARPSRADRAGIEAEAARLAPFRGCATAEVSVA